jgi:hypothetical protein
MKNSDGRRSHRSLIIICAALLTFASLPTLRARTFSTSVNIVNNSSREIRNVYTSHVNADDWTQLGTVSISPNHSSTFSNINCDQQQVAIAEDQDGCFLSCGGLWRCCHPTITNDTAADCGTGSAR